MKKQAVVLEPKPDPTNSSMASMAGMLDLAWLSTSTFLACGYDTFTRLWDTRCGSYVRWATNERNCR